MELKKLIQKRWNSSAAGFSERVRSELEKRGDRWKNYIKKNIDPKPGIKILEPCCGPGFLSILFSGDGRKVIGADECDAMLEEARNNAEIFGASVKFVNMDCHKLDFPDETFDMVVSKNALWTMYNPGEAYREWARVLKPGGRIITFESSWCMEYQRRDVMEKKRALRRKYNLPTKETHYVGDISLARELDVRSMLGKVYRPDWDYKALDKINMDVEIDTGAWEYLWDDETKKMFGDAPMFMINARKRI